MKRSEHHLFSVKHLGENLFCEKILITAKHAAIKYCSTTIFATWILCATAVYHHQDSSQESIKAVLSEALKRSTGYC